MLAINALVAIALVVLIGAGVGARVAAPRWSITWVSAALGPPLALSVAIGVWLTREYHWPSAGVEPTCRPVGECAAYGVAIAAGLAPVLFLVWGLGFSRGRRSNRGGTG